MINVAIVGVGAISPAHIEAYQTFDELCQITTLCDIDLEKAREKSQDYHLKRVPVFKDFDQICEDPDIQLVSICTPPSTHAHIAIRLLKAGKHIIIEKPMAASLEECDEINRVAAEENRVVSVIAQNRFFTPMMKLKNILDQKLIGKVVHSQVDSYWWRGRSYYDLWWRGTWEKEGGGCTLNHAVHHIDILQWMNGMPAEVTAIMSNTSHDNAEVEDISVAILKYADGTMGQITSSVIHHGEDQQLIFQGEKARISVPWKVHASTPKENGFPERDASTEHSIEQAYNSLPAIDFESHNGQIYNVLKAIKHNKPVLVDGIQGRQTLELITAIYKSASEKRTVSLPLDSSDSFYTKEGIMENTINFNEKTYHVDGFGTNEITTGGEYK